MNIRWITFFAVMAVVVGHAAPVPEDPDGRTLLQQAQRTVVAYHDGQPKSNAVLRVVYFHPNDRDPLPHYAERLDRVLSDVSDFYRDGLRRLGIENNGLPLERKDGKLVLHVVRGKSAASAYSYSSGDDTAAEISAAVKDEFNMEHEHVLVIYGLCRKEADGRYVFDAPYYGNGNQRSGLCHAADCELLDPRLLTDTENRMVFTEHYYPHVEKTMAGFNSMYIGGLAHELGHALGLFHDSGMKEEATFGTSLMGVGNLTYRNELHGAKAPAFLSRISALQLVAHPFFTGSNRGRWENINGGVEDVQLTPEVGTMRIQGKVTGAVAPYAVVAYVWEAKGTDHSARSFPAALNGDGSFDVALTGLRPAAYKFRLCSLYVNGGAKWNNYDMGFDASGTPQSPWIVARAEQAVLQHEASAGDLVTGEAIARASTEDQRQLRILRDVLSPAPPLDLTKTADSNVWLSDVLWREASVGWGQVARNHYWFDDKIQNGVFLMLRGQVYDKGLYAHSPSRFVFDLADQWKTFTATVGLRDGAQQFGSAVFRIMGDGKEIYRSPLLRPLGRAKVNVSIAGVKTLELIAEGGEGHNHSSWAIWTEPKIAR